MVAGFSRRLSTSRSRSCAFATSAPRRRQVRREVALEALLRERARMAEQAEAPLAVGDDGAAAGGIARGARQRRRDRVDQRSAQRTQILRLDLAAGNDGQQSDQRRPVRRDREHRPLSRRLRP